MNYMILETAGQHYAFPSQHVAEVYELAPVTPLPHVPGYVEGLVRLAGRAMMQIGLAARLGRDADEGGVLIAIRDQRGHYSAVRVERVLANAAVADESVNACTSADSGEAHGGMIAEFQWQEHPVLVIDSGTILPEELAARLAQEENKPENPAEQNDGSIACMVVESHGERYALRLDDVAEIAECDPPAILPNAPPEVAGMVLLRGNALLTLSLNALLGHNGQGRHAAVVVILREGTPIGLLVEKVLGIRHYPGTGIHPVDKMGTALAAYAAEGEKLTGILSLTGLLPESRFDRYRQFIAVAAQESAAEEEGNATIRMLTFAIGHDRCALPLDLIERVEDAIDVAAATEGAERAAGAALILGEIVPVVDLRRVIGRGKANREQGVWLVVRQNGSPWALAVDKVERVVEILTRNIEAVRHAAGEYVGGVGRVGEQLYSILTLEPLMPENRPEQAA